MNTVEITIKTQNVIDLSFFLGVVKLNLTIQGVVYPLDLSLATFDGVGRFLWTPVFFPDGVSDLQQSQNYLSSILRDYSNTGGTGNITGVVLPGNVVRLTSNAGIFSDGDYNGNYLQSVSFSYSTQIEVPVNAFDYSITDIGDCDTIRYMAEMATGGNSDYRLILNGTTIFENWDGTLLNAEIFSLNRGVFYSGRLEDSDSFLIESVSINVPSNITQGNFEVVQTNILGGANIQINTLITIADTAPYEYAILDVLGNTSGFQTNNVFTGLPNALYTARVRDRYGCTLDWRFLVDSSIENPTEEQTQNQNRFFNISDFNTLAFFEKDTTTRPNFFNRSPQNDEIGVAYNIPFYFPEDSTIKTQFQSSYNNNIATLLRSDGQAINLPIIQIQQNIGVIEKVDCKTFPLIETITLQGAEFVVTAGRTAVYFDGGANYIPNSSVVDDNNPTSPYLQGLPEWAVVGQFVTLDGIGTFAIEETRLFDEDRGVLYFIIDVITQEATNDLIQTQFNRHPYNVYRCDFDMSLVPDCAIVLFEAGFEQGIERTFQSVLFQRLIDFDDYLKITWKADINFDDMLFVDGIDCEMWIEGRIRPFSVSSAETAENDDSFRTVKNRHRLGQRLYIPFMHPLKWHKLSLASGIGDFGEFRIEDMLLVVTQMPEAEEILDSNISNVTAEYAFGRENLSIVDGGVVLNPELGTTIGTSVFNPFETPCFLRLEDGTWILDNDGRYIEVDCPD